MATNFIYRYNAIKPVVAVWVKRAYVMAFNIYAWYWLYREIVIRSSTNFEEYLLWFFATSGMYFFVLDSKDVFLSSTNAKQRNT